MTFCVVLTVEYYLQDNIEFLDLLHHRIRLFLLKNPTDNREKIRLILRIVSVLKTWIEVHMDTILNDKTLIIAIKEFANQNIQPIINSASENLLNFIDSKIGKKILISCNVLQFALFIVKHLNIQNKLKRPFTIFWLLKPAFA